jgi:DNA repair exonuclease SbcCD ATPase subunit
MIKSITIENFMSHLATQIELAPGVTVITGPNNVGKSALVEGVRSLVHNPSPKHSIRHGAKQAVVRLELDSGEIIEWVRSDKTAFYRLLRPASNGQGAPDAEEYRKIGQSVPEDIMALLRLGLVETESGDIDIHIGNQRNPIFLLNSPGSVAASFFAASTEAEYLLRMRQALKSRVDFAKATSKTLASERIIAERELLRYQPLDLLEPDIEKAGDSYELICKNQKSIPEFAQLIKILAEREQHFFRRRQSLTILESVKPPPELYEVVRLEALLHQWQGREAQVDWAAAMSRFLVPLTGPPVLLETATLGQLASQLKDSDKLLKQRQEEQGILAGLKEPLALQPVGDLEGQTQTIQRLEMALSANRSLSQVLDGIQPPCSIQDLTHFEQIMGNLCSCELRVNQARQHQENLANLTLPPDLHDVSHLLRLIEDFSIIQARHRLLKSLYDPLSSLPAVPEAVPTVQLEEVIREIAGISRQLFQKEQELLSLEKAREQKHQEVEQLIQETGICPLCGSRMDVSHFLEAMHA